ncbi:ABC-2 type transport system ATP-binding protein [Thermosporothrix hazakensis]|jgi:ABC-2 type transport system ATP-binding protein|uniref:ABC-2 type transport system ATP-binding protein n=2 Tax=Thermosporothrix TaxID=768650 RepID=A0A326U1U7_THEHA|nr:ATP-binding cassette domain-containing protein [Thermosporothrix hazakensis]PZW24210.1 ABC-2 type transport system ATP-binding protein [Thermosporothrix hazakensis]BBH89655.1 daunorubicin resistance protein DrrA family ABC transporter ATP-binding protein [Thermosporothrix sp. COM3]GCE47841.1 daunorubicin resistance protein DrrA family ABC transporter ATP-binding protein [Thermosporothrix hazakensis]
MHDVIEVENLSKSFQSRGKQVEALRGLHMRVKEGEIFGLLGPNGAGKTTTLRILTTLLSPDEGRILVAGFNVVRESHRVRAAIGFISQKGGTDSLSSGRENLLLQARLYGLSYGAARKRVAELIDTLDLAPFIDRLAITYSGGQRRKLDLALGLVHKPGLLFLDEPTPGLDPQSRAALWEEVRSLHAAGTTIVLTTHYLDEADHLCSRLAIVNAGVVVAEGSPAQLKQQIVGDVVTLGLSSAARQAEHLLRPHVRELRLISEAEAEKLQVYVENGEERLPALLQLLNSAGIAVHTISLSRPSLDDVFLRQTGFSFKDAEKQTPLWEGNHEAIL